MGEVDLDRLRVLSRFIRSQASLTDEKTPRAGPGEVRLNNEAAMLAADALDEHVLQLSALANPIWSWRALADFFQRHGTLSKVQPKCFVCENAAIDWPPAKQHAELPNIVACKKCFERRGVQ